jgi:hypothetical protein
MRVFVFLLICLRYHSDCSFSLPLSLKYLLRWFLSRWISEVGSSPIDDLMVLIDKIGMDNELEWQKYGFWGD